MCKTGKNLLSFQKAAAAAQSTQPKTAINNMGPVMTVLRRRKDSDSEPEPEGYVPPPPQGSAIDWSNFSYYMSLFGHLPPQSPSLNFKMNSRGYCKKMGLPGKSFLG